MKSIITLIGLSLMLASCSTSTPTPEIMVSLPTITGSIVPSGITQTGLISTGSTIAKVRNIGMENNNVFLFEDGKKIEQLTTRGNVEFVWCQDASGYYVAYDIISKSGEVGLIRKTQGCVETAIDYFAINLNSTQTGVINITKSMPAEIIKEYAVGTLQSYANDTGILVESIRIPLSQQDKDRMTKNGFVFSKTIQSTNIMTEEKYMEEVWEKKIDLKIIRSLVSGNTTPNTTIPPTPTITAKPVSSNLAGTYTFQKKGTSTPEHEMTAHITIKQSGNEYKAEWSSVDYGYNETSPDTSRSDNGVGIFLPDTNGGIIKTTNVDTEGQPCQDIKISLNKNTLTVSGGPGMCMIFDGAYQKK